MELSQDRLDDLYALAAHEQEAIERETARAQVNGRATSHHRREAVNRLVQAFQEEVEEFGEIGKAGIALTQDDIRVRARQECKRLRGEGTYGFIETLLIMIALNLIAKVIVAKLLEWWSNRE